MAQNVENKIQDQIKQKEGIDKEKYTLMYNEEMLEMDQTI